MQRPLAPLVVACVLALACASVSAEKLSAEEHTQLRSGGLSARGFVEAISFNHRLRVCNAYPYSAAMDIFRGKSDLTQDTPLPYQECRDFTVPLEVGDRLDFMVGGTGAGTFAIHELPRSNAVLLLVVFRHDRLSTAVSFRSHIFASMMNPQIAVIDTYQGTSSSKPRVTDAEGSTSGASRSEELRYDSVFAVNPGIYQVNLQEADGHKVAKTDLVAVNRESYVVLRTGVDAERGPTYPEELVVYPRSSVAGLMKSGSWRAHRPCAAGLFLMAAFALMTSVQ